QPAVAQQVAAALAGTDADAAAGAPNTGNSTDHTGVTTQAAQIDAMVRFDDDELATDEVAAVTDQNTASAELALEAPVCAACVVTPVCSVLFPVLGAPAAASASVPARAAATCCATAGWSSSR
ncbi:MAG: hypothetical protein AAF648_15410, partial [Pseudomonadota bacterium]